MAEALRAGEFARATKPFDATMAAGLSPDQLRATWLGVQAQAGALTSFGAPTTDVVAGGFVRVHLPARFEQATLDLQVVVDPSTGLVKGLWVRPPGGP